MQRIGTKLGVNAGVLEVAAWTFAGGAVLLGLRSVFTGLARRWLPNNGERATPSGQAASPEDTDDDKPSALEPIKLSPAEEVGGSAATIIHHLVVSAAALYCLAQPGDSGREAFKTVVLAAAAFDIGDTLLSLFTKRGSMTCMGVVPTLLHHSVAVVWEAVYLGGFAAAVPWQISAKLLPALLLTGAADMTVIRIMRHTPVYETNAMKYITAAQLVSLLSLRGYFFTTTAAHGIGIMRAAAGGAWTAPSIALAGGIGAMSVLHLLMMGGLALSLANGGRMPTKPKKKPAGKTA